MGVMVLLLLKKRGVLDRLIGQLHEGEDEFKEIKEEKK